MVETLPYGSWPSPLGAERLAQSVVVFQGVALDGDDVWWLELRPSEGGRNVLVRNGEDVTPESFDVRTMAHEYGGGAFVVRDGTVWFSNFTDQRLYRQDRDAAPKPITPEPAQPRADRYADADLSPDGKHLYCVRERHGGEGEPVNSIVRIAADGSGEPLELWSGSDFVSNPRLSPDGTQLAWLAWDHPNMPWDTTELHVAKVTKKGLGKDRVVLGGGEVSVFQPAWSPDGVLHAVADPTGWWNLYRLDEEGPTALHQAEQEFGFPQWLFGLATYSFLDDGTIVCIVAEQGEQHLRLLHPGGGLEDTRLPWRTYFPYAFTGAGDRVAFAGASPTQAPTIVEWEPVTGEHTEHARAFDLDLAEAYVSVPEPITFPTEDGEAHALFYPPKNPAATAPNGELPPLVMNIHGGPTSATDGALRLSVQFWTTRGFAFCDLNYRGSTGYGREYRDALKTQWGVADVEDAAAAVRYLAETGQIDGSRAAIRGGSAGGWTTLCALVFDDTFAAGVSHFGVTDLRPFVTDTHKFEARYLDSLVGPWPESEELYVERSPAEHADRIDRPVLLLQGLEDAVVPPSQAEKMVAALEASGTPHAYITFEGEQHGWRQASTIIRAHEAELAFYGEVFGFSPADDVEPVELR